jgi:YVTN family beta-propeller protein
MRDGALLVLIVVVVAGCASSEPPPEPTDLLLVVGKSENSTWVLDLPGGERRGVLVTGVAPHEVAVHPSGLAAVTNYGTRENPGFSLTVLDLHQMRAVRTIGLGRFRRPHGIRFFRDAGRVAVTAEDAEVLLVVNLETGRVEKAIPTLQRSSRLVVLSPDETRAYVSNSRSGTVSVLDIERSRLVTNLRVGVGTEGLDISPDGRELWVANRGEDTVVVIDTESLEILAKLDCAEHPVRVRFTPDGRRVLVSNARTGDVAMFSAPDRREIARVSMKVTPEEREAGLHIELSPVPVGITVDGEGSRAYVVTGNVDQVAVVDLEGLGVIRRLPTGHEPDGLGWVRLWPPVSAPAARP